MNVPVSPCSGSRKSEKPEPRSGLPQTTLGTAIRGNDHMRETNFMTPGKAGGGALPASATEPPGAAAEAQGQGMRDKKFVAERSGPEGGQKVLEPP